MKSNLQNKIKQAEHFIIVGPMAFSFNQIEAELSKMQHKKLFVFFVDGGVKYREDIEKILGKSLFHSLSLGDNDSTLVKLQLIKKDQQMSDLAFTLKLIKDSAKQISAIFFYGFLGKSPRYDHLFVNLGEISTFQKAITSSPFLSMEEKIFFFKKGQHVLSIKGTFSLLTLAVTKIEISGECEFHFAGTLGVLSSQGLSNKGLGMVSIESNGPFIVTKNKR